MELPQPRPFKSQGREPTHDFLSLCTHPTRHPDPKPTPSSSSQGSHLKTHDFLQPLECVSGAKEEETSRIDTTSSIASVKPPLQHVLPGGIGTYTISAIPYLHNHPTTMGQWPAQSMTNNNPLSGFSSRSSSQGSGLKSQSFMDMIRSAKGTSQDDDLDDEEDFIMKKESSSTSQIHTDLRVKAEARGAGNNDPKLNTPRSKHSATEQRRRSKINDRFQMLRQLIPNSDQKRDKASFLLEVIEYIQFLQEKTNKYETPYQGWNQEPAKLLNWRSNQQLVPEATVAFAPKLEEEKNNIPVLATAQGVVTTHLYTRVAPSETVEPSPSSRSYTQPLKEEEEEGDDEEVHEGNISISSVYSQGLVKRLREALEKSGVDLTKTSISVQIELAKHSSSLKDHEVSEPVSRTRKDKQTRRPKRLKTYNTS